MGATNSKSQQFASWLDIDVEPVAQAAWSAAKAERATRYHRPGRCPTRHAPYGPQDPTGIGLRESCQAGCLDLHHELMARMVTQLRHDRGRNPGRIVRNPGAYLARIAGTQLVEIARADRVNLGFQAKPTRDDGAAGRVVRELERVPGTRGRWLVALFRMMRAYPFSPTHVPGRWPIEGFLEERRKLPGAERLGFDDIRADINFVYDVTRDVLGVSWLHENLTVPLCSHAPTQELPQEHAAATVDPVDVVFGRQFQSAYRRLVADDMDSDDALREACAQAFGIRVSQLTPAVWDAVGDLLHSA